MLVLEGGNTDLRKGERTGKLLINTDLGDGMMVVEEVLERYPRTVRLRDCEVVFRPLRPGDADMLCAYFQKDLDDRDIAFLKDNVRDCEVLRGWCENIKYERVFPLVALVGERIVANSSLHMGTFGWTRCVGKVRITVARDMRGKGLGAAMVGELEEVAKVLGLERLWAEVVVEAQAPAAELFKRLGFVEEGRLQGIAKDPRGELYDVAIYIKRLVDY